MGLSVVEGCWFRSSGCRRSQLSKIAYPVRIPKKKSVYLANPGSRPALDDEIAPLPPPPHPPTTASFKLRLQLQRFCNRWPLFPNRSLNRHPLVLQALAAIRCGAQTIRWPL